MKTVCENFLTYSNSLLTGTDDSCKKKVALGIKAFLCGRDMLEKADPDGRIARRELLLFKKMPVDTFVTFFENYEICSEILQFRRDCERLATKRLINDTLISPETKTRKLSDFYDLIAELALDNRYSSWIDDITVQVRLDLAFAAGQTANVSDDIVERFAMELEHRIQSEG